MEEFLRFALSQLVEFPEEAIIKTEESSEKIVFHVAVRKTDVPKIIGKGGHTIQALRTLLNAAAQRRGLKAGLEILE